MWKRLAAVAIATATSLASGCAGTDEGPQGLESPGEAFTHAISTSTAYYLTGPQQARPPEGEFAAGTKVRVTEDAGSYVRVVAEDGTEAYVSSDALEPLEE